MFLHRIVSILIYNEVKKRAESAGQTVSDYMLGVVEDMLDGDKDLILLLRNTYEENLSAKDFASISGKPMKDSTTEKMCGQAIPTPRPALLRNDIKWPFAVCSG